MCSILSPPVEGVDYLPFLRVRMHYTCFGLTMMIEVARYTGHGRGRGALIDRSLREQPSHVLSIKLAN